MNRQRLANIFWFLFFVYVVTYVGGQASSLLDHWVPREHKNIVTPADPYKDLTPVQIGEKVFQNVGCQACHQVGLSGGVLGPSFSNVGVRRSESWLRKQLADPQAHVPGNYMPGYPNLSAVEVDGLVAYMKSLDASRQGPETQEPVNLVKDRYDPAKIVRGQEVFLDQGCSACHTIAGVSNGAIGPNLTHEGLRGRSDTWQKDHIRKPLSVYAGPEGQGANWPMPSFSTSQINDADLDALVAYLQSLR